LGVQFLMNFFVMNALLVPPKHLFPIGRLLLWFAFGNIGFREGYEDISTWNTVGRKHNPVEGRHRWLSVAIIFTEALLSYKYRFGTGNLVLDAPTPLYVWLPWALLIAACFAFWLHLRFFKQGRTKRFIEPSEDPDGPARKEAIRPILDPKKKNK
jgi:hypothetical protein